VFESTEVRREKEAALIDDRHELQEMAGTVSLGVLAEEMILALGKLKRDEKLADPDVRTLNGGHQLLSQLGAEAPATVAGGGVRRMGSESALDVYRAVRIHAPDQPVRDVLRKLAAPLGRAASRQRLRSEDRTLLPQIQALFVVIGELALAHANELLDRGRKEPLGWIGSARGLAS
jgi:hypothetical protein